MFFFDEVEDGGRFEAAEHDVLEAAHDAELGEAPTVGVEERDGMEEDVGVGVVEAGCE